MTLSTPLLAAAPLVAGLLGPALVGAAPGVPQPIVRPAAQAQRTDVVEHAAARTPADQQRVLDYWTPERMAAALPIDLLDAFSADGPAAKNRLVGKGGLIGKGDLVGKGGLIDEGGLTGRVGLGLAPELANGAARVIPRHQSARPLTTTSGSRWLTGGAVTRTTGRVFLTLDGVDFVCSAGTVRSANRDLVVTAGHCVKDGAGAWARNWTFVPGYRRGGERPYGSFTARRMFVAGPWARSGDDSHDLGMVALNRSGGRHVADVVGFQEIAFNRPRGGQIFGFGYPADPPYDGEHLVYCSGRVHDDPHDATRDQGLGCDMTAGSSGGPWLSSFDPGTGRGVVTSVSSFKYSNDSRTMYGPYFGEVAKALFSTAERA
ncbi:trypsin-like serine peptidase [Thermoactinospora rubra]|uniref:trypsin-like serine peptidase n=1 Tax=Thermoactinospora rubra TaxID=1088767 RepID=UPI000A10B495|nr:hypothetical protein [Thermoactinospora rubra]